MSRRRPFGAHRGSEQSSASSVSVISTVLKQARASGCLNLSNRSLTEVPDTVWRINIDVPPEARDVAFGDGERWWDQVELNKLILASNQIKQLSVELRLLTGLVTLDVHDNEIDELPHTIGELQRLQKLNASHNKIKALPESLMGLQNLTVLHVQHNLISCLPGLIFVHLTYLEDLDLSHNLLVMLPDEVASLSRLMRLNVSENKLTCLPATLGNLSALKFLDASNNSLNEIPDSVGSLPCLELLYLRHNRLTKLPLLMRCECLKELHLGNNSLMDLPAACLSPLAASLVVLELRDNKLSSLPDEISLLQQLQRLDLTNNNLSGLPCQMGRMSTLTSMQLEGNPLKALRRDIIARGTQEVKKYLVSRIATENELVADCRSTASEPGAGSSTAPTGRPTTAAASRAVAPAAAADSTPIVDTHTAHVAKIIDVSNRCSVAIPPEVWQAAAKFEVLQLNISRNQLSQFPLELCNLSRHLRDLNLAFNKLTSIPLDISLLAHLQNLDLRNNMLNTLPAELAQLQNLRELVLSCNRFSEVPAAVYELRALENLFASDNSITSINVPGLQKLPKLACLDLQNNSIGTVPPELGRCDQLRSLLLSGNPFRNPRAAILAKGTPALLEYLQSRIAQ